ncbi:hypothetical protein MNBD_ACTINO01-2448 [hydrothermal vent metagenome]|uniref:histidine kinase n=1 Tax=hydrothermal vent metagenome TaxID=652676 RepID=A0A3B0TIE3_9ZZZZ
MTSDTFVAPPAERVEPRFGSGAIAMFVFLAISAAITIVANTEVADAVGFIAVLIGTVASGWLYLQRSRHLTGRERLGWSMIGAGLLIVSVGIVTVAIRFFVIGDAPAFGLTDLFFFTTYVLAIAAVWVLPQTHGSGLQRTRMVIDGLIGAIFFGALLLNYVVSPLAENLASASITTRTIGMVYPFLDLLVLTIVMLVLLRRSAHRFDSRLALFSVGIAAQVLGDVMYVVSAQSGSFEDASPPYAINLFGIGAFFASAYLLRFAPTPREYAERTAPLWTVIVPYAPAVGLLVLFIVDSIVSESVDYILLTGTIFVGLLVIARQGVAIAENRAHIEQQRNALVSTISHELRTPLTAIAGFVDIIREADDSIDDDERYEMLDIVHQQTDYMSRIVSDLIMLARGTGSEINLIVREVTMIDLVTSAIHASGVAPQSVTVDCPPDLIGFVDPGRLQQVLVNLLTNAARYGGPHRLVRVSAKGSGLILEVHDDGTGIPRRYEVRVWERFERGPNRLNAAIPGSGIGLAIVQAIASAHGGTASYRTSEELGGACFAVTLPARGAVAEAQQRQASHFSEAVRIRPVA